ncbi:cytochrome c biogenesis protein DipZ, partial [Escherichia coli]
VLLDGKPLPATDAGTDVGVDGSGVVDEHRLYQLVRQRGTVSPHRFEIEFLDAGVQAYAFTFG